VFSYARSHEKLDGDRNWQVGANDREKSRTPRRDSAGGCGVVSAGREALARRNADDNDDGCRHSPEESKFV